LGVRSWQWGTYVAGPVVGAIVGANLYASLFAGNKLFGLNWANVVAPASGTKRKTSRKK
jgi:hypothetical protein